MRTNLQFDFTVDRANNKVLVTKAFNAGRSLVWDAFTKPEILDQWWAPKPWESRTKFMDFKVGGRRFYAMVSPEGQEHWSVQEFTSISPETNFKYIDTSTDKDQNINNELPPSDWNLDFSEENGITTVKIAIKHGTVSDLDKIIRTGFQQGFTMTLNYLTGLLANSSQQ